VPNYARFFQNLSSKHSKKLNLLKDFSAGTAFVTSALGCSEVEKRYAQTFFDDYRRLSLTPKEKNRYDTDADYREKMREETQQAYRLFARPDI